MQALGILRSYRLCTDALHSVYRSTVMGNSSTQWMYGEVSRQ